MPKASNELLNRIIVGIIYSSIFLLVVHNSKNIYFAFWLLLLLILSVIEFIKITKNSKNFLFKLVITLAFILFPFFCIFLIKLNLNDGEQVLTFLLLLIWCSDVSSYLIGKYFGKIKLSKISPNKTLEGYIVSHISCLIMGPILISLLKLNLNINSYLLSILIPLLANYGDYLESLLKRKFNKKDSGNLLMSHGGILDRLDSLLFSAPLFYFILN